MKKGVIKCKVCQVETARRIRCGALVCEACKRFFMRQKRQYPNGSGKKCNNRNGQCLKEVQDNGKLTRRGWLWRGMCAACRYKKCIQVGMQYREMPTTNSSVSVSPPLPLNEQRSDEKGQEVQVSSSQSQSYDFKFLIDYYQLVLRGDTTVQDQERQLLTTLLANHYLAQYLNILLASK